MITERMTQDLELHMLGRIPETSIMEVLLIYE